MMKCSIFCPFPSTSQKCKGKWSVRTSGSDKKPSQKSQKLSLHEKILLLPKILWVVISYLFYAVILWKKECHTIKSSPWHDGSSSSHTFLYQKNWFIQCCPSWKRESFTTSAEAKWLFRQASYHPKWGVSLKDSISTNFKSIRSSNRRCNLGQKIPGNLIYHKVVCAF